MNKLIFILSLSFAGALRAAQTFDPAAEFRIGENPNRVWTYGYSQTLGGVVNPFKACLPANGSSTLGSGLEIWWSTYPGNPLIAHNPLTVIFENINGVVKPGEIAMHPGPSNERAVLRFTAPQDGSYEITGAFFGQNMAPTTTDVHIFVNSQSIFDGFVNGFGPGSKFDV